MSSRIGQWLSRLARRRSLAGDGLPERMRSTTFALLGITAATGLGLVAVFSQQEWPLLPPGPLPVAPAGPTTVGDAAIAAGPSVAEEGSAQRPAQPRVIPVATAPVAIPSPAQESDSAGITGQLPAPQVSPSTPDESQPAEPPEPQPISPAQPPTVVPAPTSEQAPAPIPITAPVPPVVASPDLPEDFIDKPGKGQGNGYGHFKSDCPEANGNEEGDEQSPPPSTKEPADPAI